ncbi:MAG: transporter ATP-binding protein [Ramlibacter sp.]|nr:transporter ATP-binding protein [Ramlibacter sp.]
MTAPDATSATAGKLTLKEVAVGYVPGIDILRSIDLESEPGRITAIIGPNGAGKSTLLRCIFGLLKQRVGEVTFGDTSITGLSSHERKLAGIAYVPQHHSTCPHLTVEENLRLGGWLIRKDRVSLAARMDSLYETFPVLAARRKVQATQLSGGQLRTLAVAKEMVVPPRLLLIDEPSVGMAPKVAAELYEMLSRIPSWGATVLLVDQNITDAVAISDRVYLIGEGRVQREGTGKWFSENIDSVVKEMLLGS